MKEQRSFKLSTLLVLTFILTTMFSMSVFAAPAKVTGLKQTDARTNSVEISWQGQVFQYARYEVSVSTDGGVTWNVASKSISSPKYTVSGLSAGQTCYVKVLAYDYWNEVYGEYSDPLQVVTAPDYETTITQTKATTSSVTVKWNAIAGATGYRVCISNTSSSSAQKDLGTVTAATATIKGLSAGGSYYVWVYPVRKSSTGYVASYAYGYSYKGGIKTLPSKVKNLDIANYWQNLKEVNAQWGDANADGYQVQVYKYNGKKPIKTYDTTSRYKYVTNIKRNTYYKFRVRGYVNIGTSKKYGAWSDYKYFAQPVQFTVKSGRVKNKVISMSWTKMKGATKYTVYMSTSKNGGYKKITTTKKTAIKIKKFKKKALKWNKTYYYYVVASGKMGKKTIKTPVEEYGYCTLYKY